MSSFLMDPSTNSNSAYIHRRRLRDRTFDHSRTRSSALRTPVSSTVTQECRKALGRRVNIITGKIHIHHSSRRIAVSRVQRNPISHRALFWVRNRMVPRTLRGSNLTRSQTPEQAATRAHDQRRYLQMASYFFAQESRSATVRLKTGLAPDTWSCRSATK